MEETIAFEKSLDFQQITMRYIPKDIGLQKDRCEKLKSYIEKLCLRKLFKFILNFTTLTDTDRN
jgi:hypothetical protein